MGARRFETSEQRGLPVSEWVLGIIAAIAVFLGLFILFGGEDQWIGIGGSVSWQVSEIAIGWAYGLLAGGVVAGLASYLLIRRERALPTGARRPRSPHEDLVVHASVFVLVNAFLWIQDIVIGDGLNYAYWVTIPWGVGLIAHAVAEFAPTTHQPLPH